MSPTMAKPIQAPDSSVSARTRKKTAMDAKRTKIGSQRSVERMIRRRAFWSCEGLGVKLIIGFRD